MAETKAQKLDPITSLKTRIADLEKERVDLQRRIQLNQQAQQQLVNALIGAEHSHQTLSALVAELEKPNEQAPSTS